MELRYDQMERIPELRSSGTNAKVRSNGTEVRSNETKVLTNGTKVR